ncbi:RNA methyltransferase tRNA(m5U54)methyltransferase [Myotisia sp. PD_48]|nr:RNA methyltransferase tRNA(m5U54)methyltransferase [Myotisia sp. PD_48]
MAGEEGPESELYLQEIDPTPVDDYFSGSEATDRPANPPHKSVPSSSALGLSGHSWERWLISIRQYSTYPPAVFIGLHFANTSLIPLATRSVADSETFLLLTRPIYQAPSLESILVYLPILAHVASGVALRLIRGSRRARLFGAETRADRKSLKSSQPASTQARLGYVLMPLLGAHILVNRLTPLYVEGGSSGIGLGYVAHGFARFPWIMSLGYAAFVGVGVWHFVGGWAWWCGWREVLVSRPADEKKAGANGGYLGSPAGAELYKRKQRRKWIVNGLSIVGTALWLAGGIGVIGQGGLGSGWEAKNWDLLYRQVPLFGRLLALESP